MVTLLLLLAIATAIAFDFTNGFHDSANAVAALVATRAATPAKAVVLAATFHLAGPLLAGTAVADTVGGIVLLNHGQAVAVVGAALTGALFALSNLTPQIRTPILHGVEGRTPPCNRAVRL